MKPRAFKTTLIAGLFGSLLLTAQSRAHPASAIVVDEKGQVFFVYTGQGLMKIDADGKVSTVYPSRGGHWMALDSEGVFARRQPKYFRRVTGSKKNSRQGDGPKPISPRSWDAPRAL